MRRFNIPKIVRPLDLAAYAPELATEIGAASPPIQMWVNMPRRKQAEYSVLITQTNDLIKKLIEAVEKADVETARQLTEATNRVGTEIARWWSEAWSQGPEESRWTVDEVEDFARRCQAEDTALWDFIIQGCRALVREHRESARKN